MKPLFIVAALIITISGAAQNVSIPEGYAAQENLRELGSMDGTGNIRTFDNRYQGIKGSPYVFENFFPGTVYLKSRNKVAIEGMNYDCVNNEIVYMEPGAEDMRMLNKFQVDLFTLHDGEETMTFVPIRLAADAEIIFAEVLYNKNSSVYKVYEKDWVKANYEGAYSADRPYDEFVDKYDLYFLKQGEQTLYKSKNSKKQLIAAFPGHEDEISSFIKKNKLKLKDDQSLVKLMEYYDSL